MDNPLAHKKCIPCTKGTPVLKGKELQKLLEQIPSWHCVEEHHLEKSYTFPDFKQALHFVNQVGAIAEHEGHHPDIYLSWGKVTIQIWTHKIEGLSESDFILAAKIEASS